eukprot:5971870-Amphidinium_carterae.1
MVSVATDGGELVDAEYATRTPMLPPIVAQPAEPPPSSRPTSARGSRHRLPQPTNKFLQDADLEENA